jgi:hypothetical protein
MLSEGRLAPAEAKVIFAKGRNKKVLSKARLAEVA